MQPDCSRPVAKLKTVSGHHPTGGALEVDLSPHGSTRSAGHGNIMMLSGWLGTDHFGGKSQRWDATADSLRAMMMTMIFDCRAFSQLNTKSICRTVRDCVLLSYWKCIWTWTKSSYVFITDIDLLWFQVLSSRQLVLILRFGPSLLMERRSGCRFGILLDRKDLEPSHPRTNLLEHETVNI